MPKLKTVRAAAKRFSKTASGRIKYKKRGLRHFLEHKSKDSKRGLRKTGYIHERDEANVAILIPYK